MSNQAFIIDQEWEGHRLDHFLTATLGEHSRSYYQQLIENGAATVNDATVKVSRSLKSGDRVSVTISVESLYPNPEKLPLDIVFEDGQVLVLNKPAGMTVHPVRQEGTGTLVNALISHAPSIVEAVHDATSSLSRLRPGIVHRLDKDTSGIMVVAKTYDALINLAAQFKDRSVDKEYRALVEGRVEEAKTIHTLLKRQDTGGENKISISRDEEGREAITHVSPLSYYDLPNGREATLLACTIMTGRTHQIRVHCKHISHPLLGDTLYNTKSSRESSARIHAKRQLLHAAELSFNHPVSGERLEFKQAMAADMQDILTKLKTGDSVK